MIDLETQGLQILVAMQLEKEGWDMSNTNLDLVKDAVRATQDCQLAERKAKYRERLEEGELKGSLMRTLQAVAGYLGKEIARPNQALHFTHLSDLSDAVDEELRLLDSNLDFQYHSPLVSRAADIIQDLVTNEEVLERGVTTEKYDIYIKCTPSEGQRRIDSLGVE